MTNLKDNPYDISEYLIQEKGIDDAFQKASDGIMKSQKECALRALMYYMGERLRCRERTIGSMVLRHPCTPTPMMTNHLMSIGEAMILQLVGGGNASTIFEVWHDKEMDDWKAENK